MSNAILAKKRMVTIPLFSLAGCAAYQSAPRTVKGAGIGAAAGAGSGAAVGAILGGGKGAGRGAAVPQRGVTCPAFSRCAITSSASCSGSFKSPWSTISGFTGGS